jgi:hypothetical protein
MTREDIIKMAREAGLCWQDGEPMIAAERLERFAALVAATEREACATLVENYAGAWDDQGYALAQAIRARGNE